MIHKHFQDGCPRKFEIWHVQDEVKDFKDHVALSIGSVRL